MMKKLLGAPLILTLILTLIVFAGMLWPAGPMAYLENTYFDFWSVRFRAPDSDDIAIITIDEKSIRKLGDWPWPRSYVADVVQKLTAESADAMGICLLFTQPAINPGLEATRQLKTQLTESKFKGHKKTVKKVAGMLGQVEKKLNEDALLISAIRRAKNTVLPFRLSRAQGNRQKPSTLLAINAIRAPKALAAGKDSLMSKTINAGIQSPHDARSVWETYSALARKAGGLGHLNVYPDSDGVVRRIPLLLHYQEWLYPSLALQMALKHTNGHIRDLEIDADFWGQPRLGIQFLRIDTDRDYQMLINYDDPWTVERTYSFTDVRDGTVKASQFKHKIVLIGMDVDGMAPAYRMASQHQVPDVKIVANTLARILSTDRLSRPSWAVVLEAIALLYFAFFLVFVVPRVEAKVGASILLFFMICWYAIGVGLFMVYGYWVKVYGPILLAAIGFAMIQAAFYSRKRQQEKLDINKTLGLSFQSQGMLDQAYEKFMQCPVKNASVKHLLYSLGLDFERKRMFNKAVSIYEHIRTDGTFKDIKERISRLQIIEDPMGMTVGGSAGEKTMVMNGTGTKPTFGRYEIIRPLGRGAMGTVYLGRDPKINRQVAIKTMEYGMVGDAELPEVKKRFFREAEAAGKLSHPNIVGIYDAGDEHDMAYIAMELLTGEELVKYCQSDHLMLPSRVLKILTEVTVALEYAHKQGVVHRDIKPANIMLLDGDKVKVTDFGVARVVDASQTKTGTIMGTPSYMSPEQVAGKNVDGRSDLFALGVILYQLLSGQKPFKGDNITTIMYAITNSAFTPLSQLVPNVPTCLEQMVKKMLAKGVTKRYRSATQLLKAIKACQIELEKTF